MDLFVEKWEKVVQQSGVNIVRIHAKENEKEMVDAFYTYLLGVDTTNHDIPIIFETIYHDDEQYSKALLDELKELIDLWNSAKRDEVDIETIDIKWTPDYNLISKENPVFCFAENLNRLASYLNLAENIFLVAILKVSFVQPQQFINWLEFLIRAGLYEKCKIVIDDTESTGMYNKIALKYPSAIATLRPDLDMDTAMHQVAAMGNPNDPAVQYRQAFLKMMLSIEQRKQNETVQHANTCIEIANLNITKNTLWIGQLIAVYAALANDQVGYRNFKRAVEFASEGIEAAERSKDLVQDEMIYRKFQAQAYMMRAAMYSGDKNWNYAVEDFSIAALHYEFTRDYILALEAKRMIGFAHYKYGDTDAACKALASALRLCSAIPSHMIRFTTFPGIVELLLKINNRKYISDADLAQVAEQVYGPEWMKEILNWKNPHYEPVTNPAALMGS
jgi:tetratricopeptide (TPR) repeat protein